jgi:REP element-mobilizing transposase RayT
MAQSLSHLIVLAVFSAEDRRALLRSEEIRSETHSYMAGILKNLQCHPIEIGGADDHVHILSSLSKNITFAEMIGRVKGWSSKRLSEKGVLGFACNKLPKLRAIHPSPRPRVVRVEWPRFGGQVLGRSALSINYRCAFL